MCDAMNSSITVSWEEAEILVIILVPYRERLVQQVPQVQWVPAAVL